MNHLGYRQFEAEQMPSNGSTGSDRRPDGIWAILWRRRKVVLLVTALCLVVGGLYALKVEPLYKSTSRVYVEPQGPTIINPQQGVMTRSRNYLHTQGELFRSSAIIEDALSRAEIKSTSFVQETPNACGRLRNATEVDIGILTDLIDVSVFAPNPEEAALLANGLVDAYVDYHDQHKRHTNSQVLEILRSERAKREVELKEKTDKLVAFKRENAALSFETDDNNVIIQRLARLSEALTEAQLEMSEAMAYYQAISNAHADATSIRQLAEQFQSETLMQAEKEESRLRTQISEINDRLAAMRREGTGAHPQVQTLELEKARVGRLLAQEEKHIVELCRSLIVQRWAAAMEKEGQIRASLEAQQELALDLNAKATEYAVLESDVDRIKDLFDTLDKRIKEITVDEDAKAMNITVLEPAQITSRPVRNRRTQLLLISLLVGFMAGMGLAILVDRLDPRLHGIEQISHLTRLPVLGTVPLMGGKAGFATRAQEVFLASGSAAAEAYRAIRTSIYFSADNDKSRTMLITSPQPGEGKTTMATNLAITMAQAGQRTLIIDADLRHPMVARVFKLNNEKGLSLAMAGWMSYAEAIQSTPIAGLDVLPCGPKVLNPAELLNSQAFSDIIQTVLGKYDRVIIDSPPVVPVSDARIIAGQCAATLLVMRAGFSTHQAGEEALHLLNSVGARILGVAVNAAHVPQQAYAYYYNNESSVNDGASTVRSTMG